jgi:hypothetical protein
MPCVGFETTIPASDRAKTVHSLGRSATMTGDNIDTIKKNTETLTGANKKVGQSKHREN